MILNEPECEMTSTLDGANPFSWVGIHENEIENEGVWAERFNAKQTAIKMQIVFIKLNNQVVYLCAWLPCQH